MSIFSLFGFGKKQAPSYPSDTIKAPSGAEITVSFFGHASIGIDAAGRYIYIDPVGEYADYHSLPGADIIMITHSHYDHFDMEAVESLRKSGTVVICDKTTAEAFEFDCITMTPGAVSEPMSGITVEAVPAYNITDGHLQFHPAAREDCGYIITVEGLRIYVAGDTENNDDVKALRNIDVAFLPVNQPYTMTVEQAADVVRAIRPRIFYPYHYGGTDTPTDILRLERETEGITEVRIRPLE